jgi:hypothetical protein
MYLQQLTEMFSPPTQNTIEVCNQITLFILYYISSGLVTDVLITFSDIFYFTDSFKFINFSFQVFLLFVPEMSTSFASYIV